MDLSIIIVNWKSAGYLRKCLESIYAQTKELEFEVIVIDNGSFDGSDEIMTKEFPSAKFIQSEKNLGFARANNLGFAHSLGETLLFLNPDTEIVGEAINRMFSNLHQLPEAGAVGCKMLNSDLTVQTRCVRAFPNILNQIMDIEFLKLKLPKLPIWGIKPLFYNDGKASLVEAISGACMMIPRRAFQEIDLFSEDYFMYSEDLDLCYKLVKRGYKIYYIEEARIIHHGGRSSNMNSDVNFADVLIQESRIKLLEKMSGKKKARIYKISMGLAAAVRLIVIISIMPWWVLKSSDNSVFRTFNKWKRVLRWSLGLEKWAKILERKD